MRATKPQPFTPARATEPSEAERRATAFGVWMLSNVRREIVAGRVRSTVDEDGERHAIN